MSEIFDHQEKLQPLDNRAAQGIRTMSANSPDFLKELLGHKAAPAPRTQPKKEAWALRENNRKPAADPLISEIEKSLSDKSPGSAWPIAAAGLLAGVALGIPLYYLTRPKNQANETPRAPQTFHRPNKPHIAARQRFRSATELRAIAGLGLASKRAAANAGRPKELIAA
ncbi:MAG: hypothetical protein HYT79_07410 [Elusimicrobia bacterium]|nr:hypothetical protein [Elusimicrobiota bacterium]